MPRPVGVKLDLLPVFPFALNNSRRGAGGYEGPCKSSDLDAHLPNGAHDKKLANQGDARAERGPEDNSHESATNDARSGVVA